MHDPVLYRSMVRPYLTADITSPREHKNIPAIIYCMLNLYHFTSQEEIRNLSAKLAVFENKLARENKRKGSSPEDEYKMHGRDSQTVSADSETESARDLNGFPGKRRRKRSTAAESTTSNGSVFVRDEKAGSLIDNITNAGKQDKFLAVPKKNSISDEETLTVMSNISGESVWNSLLERNRSQWIN